MAADTENMSDAVAAIYRTRRPFRYLGNFLTIMPPQAMLASTLCGKNDAIMK